MPLERTKLYDSSLVQIEPQWTTLYLMLVSDQLCVSARHPLHLSDHLPITVSLELSSLFQSPLILPKNQLDQINGIHKYAQ